MSLIAGLTACTSSATRNAITPDSQTNPDEGPLNPIWNQQGSELLAAPPGLEPFSVATTGWGLRGAPVAIVEIVDGELRMAGRGGETPVGASFLATAPDGSQSKMRISAVIPHHSPRKDPPSRVRYDYVVEYQHAGAWHKLCPERDGGAMVIPGSFGINPNPKGPVSNGDYELSADRLMFSCHDGVAAKCVDWGYAPWSDHARMAAYYQACTRMARADYCGTGHSRTVEGTTINYGDLHDPPVTPFVPMSGFAPEAVWGPGRGTKGQSAAICLARSRWRTIPFGDRSPCAELMPDPRTSAGASQRFCDDMTVADWSERGAMFINMSRIIDVGLVRWTDGAGHYQTTAEFPWDGNEGGNDGVPSDAHGPPGYPTFVGIEGSIYRSPPPVMVRGLVPLYRYTRLAGDTRLALTTTEVAPGDGFDDRVLEGYVFAPSADAPVTSAQALILYRDDHGSFATTSDPTPPAGFTRVRIIGWLPH
ncbi:MAG TPA: ADYC domain-containing protein [Kofleriaceae bacterium]